jgi:hypothetical protein
MTQKGALTVWQLMSSTFRFFHFVGESEGEVQLLMMHLHGLILLIGFSMILGRRLGTLDRLEYRVRKVKCKVRLKGPRFRDHFHRSFATRFRRIGVITLLISPPRVVLSNPWVNSIKFWKPGWHIRRQRTSRRPHRLKCGYWMHNPPQINKEFSWDDPVKRSSLSIDRFADVCGICDATIPDMNFAMRPSEGAYIFHDLGTRSGRLKMARCIKRVGRSELNVFVTTANAKTERTGVYNLSSGKRNYNASDFSIIWDTGASQTVTFSKEDFTTGIDYFTNPQSASGIASGLEILGKGMVRWDISLNDGSTYPIAIEALYCPKANRRLL